MNNLKLAVTVLAVALISAVNVNSQPCKKGQEGSKPGCLESIPGLTDKQKEDIEKLRVAHMEQMHANMNELKEKEAELNMLETADEPDMKAIENKVDEIGVIKTKMMKERAMHKQDVRKLLDAGQKVYFDAHHMHKGHCGEGNSGMGCRRGHKGENCPKKQ